MVAKCDQQEAPWIEGEKEQACHQGLRSFSFASLVLATTWLPPWDSPKNSAPNPQVSPGPSEPTRERSISKELKTGAGRLALIVMALACLIGLFLSISSVPSALPIQPPVPVLEAFGCDQQGQDLPQGIHCRMDLAALAPFGPIVACSRSAFWTRLERAAIENNGCGLLLSCGSDPQELAQIVDHYLKDSRLEPALSFVGRPLPTAADRWAASAKGRLLAPASASH